MPIYVTVLKSVAEAMRSMDDFGKWYEEYKKILEQMGIKHIGAYALLGRYDMMFIYEASDEKAAMRLALSSSTGSVVPSETWTAIPMEQFAKIAATVKH